jgi:hypothetical protein
MTDTTDNSPAPNPFVKESAATATIGRGCYV